MSGFLTVRQTADRIGLTRQAIQAMIKSNRITAIWMLERWAIPESEANRLAKSKAKKFKKAA